MQEKEPVAAQEEDEGDLASVMAAADLDGDGTLNYEEFIAATANLSKLERETNILSAFRQFDTDHSGALSKTEVMAALTSMGSSEQEIEVTCHASTACQNISVPEHRQVKSAAYQRSHQQLRREHGRGRVM